GPLNVGGLGGERHGWFLPGFPGSAWASTTLPHSTGTAGGAWYRSTVTLNLPAHQDTPLALSIVDSASRHYSALLYVNGWQLGRYVNDIDVTTQPRKREAVRYRAAADPRVRLRPRQPPSAAPNRW